MPTKITEGLPGEKAKVVAIHGRAISGDKFMWGDIASQLGKGDTFSKFWINGPDAPRENDWIALIGDEPTLILLDELPPYFDFAQTKTVGGGTLANVTTYALSNLLSAAMKLPKTAIVISNLVGSYQGATKDLTKAISNLAEETKRQARSITPVDLNTNEIYDILRKRMFTKLPDQAGIEKIAESFSEAINLFEDQAVRTTADFDHAYLAVEKFTKALSRRVKGAGFMQNLLRQRICSSVAAGLSTCRKLIESRQLDDDIVDDESEDDVVLQFNEMMTTDTDLASVLSDEIGSLREVIYHLEQIETDPKLEVCTYFLDQNGWLEGGCIIFSQYYDTARWIADRLSGYFPDETVAVYGGAGRSGIFLEGQWRSVDREDIKKAVKNYEIRLVVATDAAAEGLNLHTLTSLINVDLPWNPSRLEQRIGRIKRYGQKRDVVNLANLVYQGTVDEKVYNASTKDHI